MSIPADVVLAVETRAWGYCEGCGLPERGKMDLHHRQAKGMGGRPQPYLDTAENLIRMHHDCHMKIHAAPERAIDFGLIVPEWAAPAEIVPYPDIRLAA